MSVAPKVRHHVVITGTGRAGTSFLMQLLTTLGLQTGFAGTQTKLNENARAGLEWDIHDPAAPYIVKSPYFCEHAAEVLERKDIAIDHVLVPMRDIHAAAESRRFVLDSAVAKLGLVQRIKARVKPPKVPGGLFNTKNKSKQESVLLLEFHRLMLALSSEHIPLTLLQYPKLVKEKAYLYEKLRPILGSISEDQFTSAFQQTVRPDWIHSFAPGEGGGKNSKDE
jgi:hypothetical protein